MLSKGQTWPVLDHGYVKYINSMGDDEEIVEAARMSTGRGFVSWEPYKRCETCDLVDGPLWMASLPECDDSAGHKWKNFPRGDVGFMEYLYSHKHMTPFEMPDLIIEFKAPIMVIWEWVRHRTMSFNIESGRYTQLANEHYLPSKDRFKKQSTTNKQDSSIELFDPDTAALFIEALAREQEQNYETYEDMVAGGVAKELARLNAPMARYSRGRVKANLRNWLAFLLLRKQTKHSNPQWEIAQYADVIGEIIKSLYPRTYELFEEYTLYAETFSRSEMRALRILLKKVGVNPEKGSLTMDDPEFTARTIASLMAKLKG
jgi:thymidylate synthase (FAD)